MKILKALPLTLVTAGLVALLGSSDASADNKVVLSPAAGQIVLQMPPGWSPTVVKGTIKTPGGTPTSPAGFGCGDLSVTASSKEMVQPPPNPDGSPAFAYPKWERHVNATGQWSSGECKYTLFVPPNSAFYLNLSWGNHGACDYVSGITASPGYTGPFTLPKGGSKVQDYTIAGTPQCGFVH